MAPGVFREKSEPAEAVLVTGGFRVLFRIRPIESLQRHGGGLQTFRKSDSGGAPAHIWASTGMPAGCGASGGVFHHMAPEAAGRPNRLDPDYLLERIHADPMQLRADDLLKIIDPEEFHPPLAGEKNGSGWRIIRSLNKPAHDIAARRHVPGSFSGALRSRYPERNAPDS